MMTRVTHLRHTTQTRYDIASQMCSNALTSSRPEGQVEQERRTEAALRLECKRQCDSRITIPTLLSWWDGRLGSRTVEWVRGGNGLP